MRSVLAVTCMLGVVVSASASQILVYDQNTHYQYALTGAAAVPGAVVTRGYSSDFNTLLTTGGPWDVVAVDCPSTIPAGGWTDLQNYVTGGGAAVMAYWDWDAYSALASAFGVSVVQSFSMSGVGSLEDLGSPLFAGISMPHTAWHNSWYDDGDTFTGEEVAHAKLAAYPDPVIVSDNGGMTIASLVLDEWNDVIPGEAAQLWTNMIMYVPEPASLMLLGVGGLLAIRRR